MDDFPFKTQYEWDVNFTHESDRLQPKDREHFSAMVKESAIQSRPRTQFEGPG